jgi:hypothetical protein
MCSWIILSKVVSSISAHGEVYSIQHYVIKACQWTVAGQWFSLGTPVSSINKIDHHYITETLLNTITTLYHVDVWSVLWPPLYNWNTVKHHNHPVSCWCLKCDSNRFLVLCWRNNRSFAHCRLDSKIICFYTFLKELFSLREGTGPFHAKFNENKIYISHNLYLTRFHCCKSLLIF